MQILRIQQQERINSQILRIQQQSNRYSKQQSATHPIAYWFFQSFSKPNQNGLFSNKKMTLPFPKNNTKFAPENPMGCKMIHFLNCRPKKSLFLRFLRGVERQLFSCKEGVSWNFISKNPRNPEGTK